MKPREIANQIEANPALPDGQGDRFAGYGVMSVPFRSGHILALRRFPASSIGPGYSSVWHRDPQGRWTIYTSVEPNSGCSRYFGREVWRDVVCPIEIEWTGATEFSVKAGEELRWDVALAESASTRAMNAMARVVPESWWHSRLVLRLMASMARVAFDTGKLNLTGRTPNGQEFTANPLRLWLVGSSRAVLNGTALGPAGALEQQARLADFFVPQRGLFAVARAFMRTPQETDVNSPGECS